MVLISLIVLYGLIACIKYCCMKQNSAPIAVAADTIQSEGVEAKFKEIINRTSECKFQISNNKFVQNSCTICLGDFVDECLIRKLMCSHIFHKDCIESWIKTNINHSPRCPVCNVELAKEKLQGPVPRNSANNVINPPLSHLVEELNSNRVLVASGGI